MTPELSVWQHAIPDDVEELLPLLEAFYSEEQLDHDAPSVRSAVVDLLADPDLGGVWLLRVEGVLAGYLIATLGFSVEFGGRYVLLDELFILPEFRGGGKWRQGFREVESWARQRGIHALRLEVNHHNEKAGNLYLADGFSDDERSIFTKRLG
ncbi:MAG: GNAT family N-acetyltransferase [Akkermansiaceae bacterium]|nr:GNAT family N-acetyltransferase [Akkermansiaceae bacterium]